MSKSTHNTNTSLSALNDMLFQQLEAITNPDLEGDELQAEIERTKAVSQIANNIINGAKVELQAIKFNDEFLGGAYDCDMFMLPSGANNEQ